MTIFFLIKIAFTFSELNVETPDVSASSTLPLSIALCHFMKFAETSGVSTFGSKKINSIFIR